MFLDTNHTRNPIFQNDATGYSWLWSLLFLFKYTVMSNRVPKAPLINRLCSTIYITIKLRQHPRVQYNLPDSCSTTRHTVGDPKDVTLMAFFTAISCCKCSSYPLSWPNDLLSSDVTSFIHLVLLQPRASEWSEKIYGHNKVFKHINDWINARTYQTANHE